MTIMMKELLEAKTAILSAENNIPVINTIVEAVKKRGIKKIFTVARGTSNHATMFFKYICELKCGMSVTAVDHSVITIHGKTFDFDDSLVIAVSQSGVSRDTREVINEAKKYNCLTVAVTNDTTSPLAQDCDQHIYLGTGEETSVAATKTFTAQMFNLYLLANAMSDKPEIININTLASKVDEFLTKNSEAIAEFASRNKDVDNMIILSRGESLSLAEEMSLKLTETCYKFSRPYSTAVFMHGPFAVLDKNRTVIFIAPNGVFNDTFIADAKKIKETGARFVSLTGIKEIAKMSDDAFEICGDSSIEDILLYTVTLQAFAANVSEKIGNNPDSPRGLNKITITV